MAAQNREDDTTVLIIFGGVALIAAMLALNYFHEQIATHVAKIKIWETWLYSFWSEEWNIVTDNIKNGRVDLAGTTLGGLTGFYNRYASIFWLLIFLPVIWKLWKMKTNKDVFHGALTMDGLLEKSSKVFPATAIWINHNLSKENLNRGPWRLAESPMLFALKHKAMRDPNGEHFHYNRVFDPRSDPAGDTPELYADYRREDVDEDREFDSYSFREQQEILKAAELAEPEAAAQGDFKLPPMPTGSPEQELKKFDSSTLIQYEDSCYLNTDSRSVDNRLDERVLDRVFSEQLGMRIEKVKRVNPDGSTELVRDPFQFLKELAERKPEEAWRYGLAAALFLHGLGDETKKAARQILDNINRSLAAPGEFKAERMDVKMAFSIALKPEESHVYRTKIRGHSAFLNPFFVSLFEFAKEKGVIITADFGWLKFFDRTLWYALNQVGRDTCWAEAAGVWSHYRAEEAVGEALGEPYVKMAIEGMRVEMIDNGYLNEPREQKRLEAARIANEEFLAKVREQKEQGYQ